MSNPLSEWFTKRPADPTLPDENGNGYYPGDATPEDIPNPETPVRTGFPAGDVKLPDRDHGTTGIGTVPNEGMQLASKTPRKDASAFNVSEDVTSEETVWDDGEPSGVTAVRETAARTYNAFSTTAIADPGVFYPGPPVLLVGADVERQRVLISNGHDTQSLLVGTLEQVSAVVGFILPPFNVFDPQVQGGIYACVPPSGTVNVPVGVWVERS